MKISYFSLPLEWGRAGVGVDRFGSPSPSSPPARGGEVFLSHFLIE